MRILVVEDDYAVRETLQDVLTALGHDVVAASDGTEALESLARIEVPDLMLVDELMPQMNGSEFLACIEDEPRFKDVPAVILSGLDRFETSTPQLKKPFALEDLTELLQKYEAPCTSGAEGSVQSVLH